MNNNDTTYKIRQKLALEVFRIANENLNNPEILEHANNIANLLTELFNDSGVDELEFNLQEYTYETLQTAKTGESPVWADEHIKYFNDLEAEIDQPH